MGAGSEVKAATTEQLRLRNYRDSLQLKHEREVQDLEDKQREKIALTVDRSEAQSKQLETAYDVQISNEAKLLDEKLEQIRNDNEIRLSEEKSQGEKEIQKAKLQADARISQIQKEADTRIEKIQEEVQTKTKKLYEQQHDAERKAAYRSDVRERRQKMET